VRYYNDSGVLQNTITTAETYAEDIEALYVGSADIGSTRIIIATPSLSRFRVYNTLGNRDSTYDWLLANGVHTRGMTYFNGLFRGVDVEGKVWDYSDQKINRVLDAAYTWVDNNATGGTHETMKSPTWSYAQSARTLVEVETPPAPEAGDTDPTHTDIANRINVYVGTSGGALKLQNATPLAVGVRTLRLPSPIEVGTTGPPGSNTFDLVPGLTGTLVAGKGGFTIDGNSAGSIGTGTFRDSVVGAGGTQQAVQSAQANPTSTTNVTLPGMSVTVTSPGTTAVYQVVLNVDQIMLAAGINIVELLVDGTAQTQQVVGGGPLDARIGGSKTYLITGLSAGSHTFTARTRSGGAYNTRVGPTHSTLTVTRVA
jgi:hypothetical protein